MLIDFSNDWRITAAEREYGRSFLMDYLLAAVLELEGSGFTRTSTNPAKVRVDADNDGIFDFEEREGLKSYLTTDEGDVINDYVRKLWRTDSQTGDLNNQNMPFWNVAFSAATLMLLRAPEADLREFRANPSEFLEKLKDTDFALRFAGTD